MKQIIDWFEIPVRDLARAKAIYAAVLQAPLHNEAYAGPGVQMAVFSASEGAPTGALVAGYPGLQVGQAGTLVYLHIDDALDAALRRVQQAGGTVALGKTALPEGLGCFAHMLDIDGNRVGLHATA